MDKTVTITLPVAAWNVVLGSLAQRPYGEVAELVEELRRQAGPQVQEIEKAAAEEAKSTEE